MWDELIRGFAEQAFTHFGWPAFSLFLTVCAMAFMAVPFLRTVRIFSAQSIEVGKTLGQMVTVLQQHQEAHLNIVRVSGEQTEVLRSMVIEARALANVVHNSDMERGRVLQEIIKTILERGDK